MDVILFYEQKSVCPWKTLLFFEILSVYFLRHLQYKQGVTRHEDECGLERFRKVRVPGMKFHCVRPQVAGMLREYGEQCRRNSSYYICMVYNFCYSITRNDLFRPDRLRQICDRFNMDQEAMLDNVLYARAYTSDHQVELLDYVAAKFHEVYPLI